VTFLVRDRTPRPTAHRRRRRTLAISVATAAVLVTATAGPALAAAPTRPSMTAVTSDNAYLLGVTVTGDFAPGGTAYARPSLATDVPQGATIAYTWVWGGMDYYPSAQTTFTVNDVGSSFVVRATMTVPGGATETVQSSETPMVSGVAIAGCAIQTEPGPERITPQVALVPGWGSCSDDSFWVRAGRVTISRTWLRDGAPVTTSPGATFHVVEEADSGHRLALRVTWSQAATGMTASGIVGPTPVVGTITPEPVTISPATGVKAGTTVTVGTEATLYPDVDATCNSVVTWYRDGKPVPGRTSYQYFVPTTEGGARLTAKELWACRTSAPLRFTQASRAASNTVTVSGKPYSQTFINGDRLRDAVVMLDDSTRWRGFWSSRDLGYLDGMPSSYLKALDGMTRMVSGADVSGDGVADALGQTAAGDLYVFDVASWGGRRLWKVGTGWGSMNALLLPGDLDGDHAGDILARRSSDGALVLYSGTGAKVLPGRVVGTGFKTATRLAYCADATGDAIPDLYATWPDGTLRMYAGRGNGGFKPGVVAGWSGWSSVAFLTDGGDGNKDGKGDLYAADRKGHVWMYPGKGNGQVGSRQTITMGVYLKAFG
jgi:hypothetical protein